MSVSIKVGFCVAYDWNLLRHSLPLIYSHSNSICLSLDRNRISWSGEKFDFDEKAFNSFINEIDSEQKIRVLESDFFLAGKSAAENEVVQRNAMAIFLGAGGWHIQLDADEYFVDFPSFTKFLSSLPKRKYSYNICCLLITLFKQTTKGFLVVDPLNVGNSEYIQIASLTPSYLHGRRNGHFNQYVNFSIVHQSWARSDEEILQKLKNWGHINDFNTNVYFTFWKTIKQENYLAIKNFHPIEPKRWPSLRFVEAFSIKDFMFELEQLQLPRLSKVQSIVKNSRLISKIKQLLKGQRLLSKLFSHHQKSSLN